jgi:UDP-N-acetylmuramyl pentapeptide synthase
MGLSQKEIRAGLKKYKATNKWPVLRKSKSGVIIMDESYNLNQQGFMTAVDYLKLNFLGKKYVMTPGIIELGCETKIVHSEIRKKLVGLDGVWVTSDWARQYLCGRTDIKEIGKVLKPEDVVLIAGRIPAQVKKMIFEL